MKIETFDKNPHFIEEIEKLFLWTSFMVQNANLDSEDCDLWKALWRAHTSARAAHNAIFAYILAELTEYWRACSRDLHLIMRAGQFIFVLHLERKLSSKTRIENLKIVHPSYMAIYDGWRDNEPKWNREKKKTTSALPFKTITFIFCVDNSFFVISKYSRKKMNFLENIF